MQDGCEYLPCQFDFVAAHCVGGASAEQVPNDAFVGERLGADLACVDQFVYVEPYRNVGGSSGVPPRPQVDEDAAAVRVDGFAGPEQEPCLRPLGGVEFQGDVGEGLGDASGVDAVFGGRTRWWPV